MRLLSVNVSQPIAVEIAEQRYHTGIYKIAVAGRLWLGRTQLAGDGQGDMENHGGPNRAVYCYSHEHYAHWSDELARDDFEYGQFGENLTTQGLLENQVCVGDAFQVGEAVIQVTQPRVPCYKLANKMGIPGFEKTFLKSNRCGFYARVLDEGSVGAADTISQLEKDPVGMTVAEVNAALYLDRQKDAAERALQIEALSPGWRQSFEKLLAKV